MVMALISGKRSGAIDSKFDELKNPKAREILFDGSGAIVMEWSNDDECWKYEFVSDR